MRRLPPLRFLDVALLVFLCSCLAGCSTAKARRTESNPDMVKLTSFCQPQLFYLLPSPYTRLYVEVDAVEGCQPSDANLNKLRDFLTTYCNKPDGIEIARGDVIPAVTARGVPPEALARKFLNGPPDNKAQPPPAYLYVLYYDSALCDKPPIADASQSGAKVTGRLHQALRNPHVDFLPYAPVIYINHRYGPRIAQNDLLAHEAGHELGLAGRQTFASDYHCLDKSCLMYWTIRLHMLRSLLGMDPIKQHNLCEHCLAQLAESAKKSPPANLRFVGPVLVRSEIGYHVLSLPDCVKIVAGDLTDKDCRDFASAVREVPIPPKSDGLRVDWLVKDEGLFRTNVYESFTRAKADPLEPVRLAAPRFFSQFCVNQGQFTNAVKICREGIDANPKDDASYNLLAWIEATCPDSSLRDGKDAVSAATKACELTQWKEFNWIDTLAAAYAESGNFERAIQFQEQALHTGSPPDSDQKEMRERLALYKQSQPYREKP